MKGLLIKEWGIIKTQKIFFFIVAALIAFAVFSNDLTFALGYISFALPVFAITTISYDEFDNGYAFLFTLPISRRLYVFEKYCLGLILGIIAIALSVSLAFVVGLFKDMAVSLEALKSLPAIVAVMIIILSVVIPIQIKFGAEKGRIAILLVGGIAVATGFVFSKLLEKTGVDLYGIIEMAQKTDTWILALLAVLITIIVFALSIKISILVINKKEF